MPRSVTITWDATTDVPTMTYTPADKPPVIPPVVTPPTDPSVLLPALSLPAGASYTFKKIRWTDSAAAANQGIGLVSIGVGNGTFAITAAGAAKKQVGFTNKATSIQGPYADIVASIATLTYTAPASGAKDILSLHFYSPADGVDRGGDIVITLRPGGTAESGGGDPTVIPPVVNPPVVVPGTVSRAIELTRMMGANTFLWTTQANNIWGASPGDFSQASVLAGNNYLGLKRNRDYFFADHRSWMEPMGKAIHAATGVRFSICTAAGGGLADSVALGEMAIASSLTDGWIEQIEGALEPNNFKIPADQAVAMQKAIWAAGQKTKGNKFPFKVAGPSVVIGMPHPEGWIVGTADSYFTAAQIVEIRNNMEVINLHFYPPDNADLASDGGRAGWLQDTITGVKIAYGDMIISATESHPTLYARAHNMDPAYDAYFGALFLFSAFREKLDVAHWFAMMDYGWDNLANKPTFTTGFFPGAGGVAPRPSAETMRAISTIMADGAVDQATFVPGKLGVTVTGLPASLANAPNSGGHWFLFQSRQTGAFILALVNSQAAPGGAAASVGVTFDRSVSKVEEFNVTDPTPGGPLRVVQTTSGTSAKVQLNASVRLLKITS